MKLQNMDLEKWKKFKRSGGYKRKVKRMYEEMNNNVTKSTTFTYINNTSFVKDNTSKRESDSVHNFNLEYPDYGIKCSEHGSENSAYDSKEPCSSSDVDESFIVESKKDNLRKNIRNWALKYNIPHIAINELSKIVNDALPYSLPFDARTLLKTNEETTCIIEMGTGHYWHNSLITQLQKMLSKSNDLPTTISLNVNIDGLPIYKSSNIQLWPILCNIAEMKNISPFVVGIYEGKTKPSDLNLYLNPFVNEMLQLQNGLTVVTSTGKEIIIEVSIRAFICDSPARALIKGVSNFNSKHGCQKCTVIGEYSHLSHTVIFPKIDCPKRNDEDFRAKKYGQHHKVDSPLLRLKIDMIENFPVSDSLHLVDLGIMKRLLVGWRDGNFIKRVTKWSSQDIEKVNKFLSTIRLPKEIHRAVRKVDVLAHWKASEFRTFLLYLGIVILKYVMNPDAYNHYMVFFCAITICSNQSYFIFLRLAKELLNSFILNYRHFYGKEYITSNVHNLSHIVDEVRKFGILQSFNAYPFENKLNMIKNLLRQGNNPLAQVARRLQERQQVETDNNQNLVYPFVKERRSKNGTIFILHLECFIISTQECDKWFLTTDNKVIETKSVNYSESEGIKLTGYPINNINDAFDYPIKSSLINIYKCIDYNASKSSNISKFMIGDIKCKLVSIKYDSEMYFIPLIHTLNK